MCKVTLNSEHVQWHWCHDAPPEFYYEASLASLCAKLLLSHHYFVDNYYIASALGSFCMQLIVLVLLFVCNYYASFSAQWLNFILIWIELQFLYSAHLQLK